MGRQISVLFLYLSKGVNVMKSISQVASLTGITIRTLQYYDKIGLLKPSKVTPSGYRLYDEEALQQLQQILFFKELDFKLKDIKVILQDPEFDKQNAFKKQKELLLLKRNRIDGLIELLNRLEKGEPCMSFKEFDLSEYIEALENFKNNHTDDVLKHWGSVENFNQFIQKIKDDESYVAQLAVKYYGSVEEYTNAMKYNLEHFSEIEEQNQVYADTYLKKNFELYAKLTSDMSKEITSDEIQNIVREIVTYTEEQLLTADVGDDYWDMVIDSYSNDFIKGVTDKRYGAGASGYIAKALEEYFHG